MIHGGHCIDIGANFTFSAVWNTAIDLVMLVLPVKAVWALQLPTAKKVQVSAVFATGLLYVSSHVPFQLCTHRRTHTRRMVLLDVCRGLDILDG